MQFKHSIRRMFFMIVISIPFIVGTVVTLIIVLCFLFFYLLWRKLVELKIKEKKDKLKSKIQPIIHDYLIRGEDVRTRLIQKQPYLYEAIEEVLEDASKLLKGTEIQERITVFAKLYLEDYYVSRLNHARWSIRMNTLYNIEDFHLERFSETLMYRFSESNSKSIEEAYQIMRTLATFQYESFLDELVKTTNVFPLFIYKSILRRLDDEHIDYLVRHIHAVNQTFELAIIDMIGERKDLSYLTTIEQKLQSEDSEVRIHSLKVIEILGFVTDLSNLVPFSESAHFTERMLFAKVCRMLKKERFKATLISMLSDESWFVRNAAGEALAAFSDGNIILEHISLTHEDLFARDMAQQWKGDKF